jgi:hypothetical protein
VTEPVRCQVDCQRGGKQGEKVIVFVWFLPQSRSMTGFLPMRDWQDFIARHWKLKG